MLLGSNSVEVLGVTTKGMAEMQPEAAHLSAIGREDCLMSPISTRK